MAGRCGLGSQNPAMRLPDSPRTVIPAVGWQLAFLFIGRSFIPASPVLAPKGDGCVCVRVCVTERERQIHRGDVQSFAPECSVPERLPWARRDLGTSLGFSASALWGRQGERSLCRALLGLAQRGLLSTCCIPGPQEEPQSFKGGRRREHGEGLGNARRLLQRGGRPCPSWSSKQL